MEPARARGLGGGATARVNGGAQRAHHPSDRSYHDGGGGMGGEGVAENSNSLLGDKERSMDGSRRVATII